MYFGAGDRGGRRSSCSDAHPPPPPLRVRPSAAVSTLAASPADQDDASLGKQRLVCFRWMMMRAGSFACRWDQTMASAARTWKQQPILQKIPVEYMMALPSWLPAFQYQNAQTHRAPT